MKRIFLLLTVTLLLIACNSVYKENIEAAEDAMANGDFESALEYYTTALEEEPDDSDVKAKVELLTDYKVLLDTIEESEWTGASELANKILKNDAITPDLKEIVNGLLVTIEDGQTNDKKVASEFKELEELIENNELDQAHSNLAELESKVNSNEQEAELTDLSSKLETKEKQIAKKEAEEKAEKETEEKRLAEDEKKKRAERASSLNAEYTKKADELNDLMAKSDAEQGVESNAKHRYSMYDQEWHNLLQDVWADLESTLPKDEFAKLKVEQNKWIDDREEILADIPDDHASTRLESWNLGAKQNAERTTYLIENHMK